jgi:hypothetical protein
MLMETLSTRGKSRLESIVVSRNCADVSRTMVSFSLQRSAETNLICRALWVPSGRDKFRDLLTTVGLTCALFLSGFLLLVCILIGFVVEMGPLPPPLFHFLSALYDQFHVSFIRH